MARVLIVDDTDIVRRALELAIRKMGHQPESASDAHRALDLAKANPPELALLDYRMPGMDGVTLYAALREALGERCPKVVFVSATPAEEMRAAAPGDLHVSGYVKKPFHLDELWRTVGAALDS
jgi:two-component system, OmpR family, response regulator